MKIEITAVGDVITVKIESDDKIEIDTVLDDLNKIRSNVKHDKPVMHDDYFKKRIVETIKDYPNKQYNMKTLNVELYINDSVKTKRLLNELIKDGKIISTFSGYKQAPQIDFESQILDFIKIGKATYDAIKNHTGIDPIALNGCLGDLISENKIICINDHYQIIETSINDQILKFLNNRPTAIYRTDELKNKLGLHHDVYIGTTLANLYNAGKIQIHSTGTIKSWSAKNA